jgi:hypothetical protein
VTDKYSFSVILEPQEEGGFTVLVRYRKSSPKVILSKKLLRMPKRLSGQFSRTGEIMTYQSLQMHNRKSAA